MSTAPVDQMIDAAVRCTLCGTAGIGNCACWVWCECGWSFQRGTRCNNPEHEPPDCALCNRPDVPGYHQGDCPMAEESA